jgi:colanic acid biosynthesis glycosyl transferase WcaI
MKILLYGINYSPELTGIGKYTGEMAVWLAQQGHIVKVITAPPYYPEWQIKSGYKKSTYSTVIENGVSVTRCPLFVPKQPTTIKRLLHLGSFSLSSSFPLVSQLSWKPDIVILVAPTLFCSLSALLLGKLTQAHTIIHIQDFEVDAMFGLGLARNNMFQSLAFSLESWILNAFDKVSTISPGMLKRAEAKGISKEKLIFLPNWSEIEHFQNATHSNELLEGLNIPIGKKIILYSGNIGEKQGLEIVIDAAKVMKSNDDRIFLIVGEGAGKARLDKQVKDANLNNIIFAPLVPYEKLPTLLASADCHLVIQKRGAADAVLPSKLTNIFAVGGYAVITADQDTSLGILCKEHPGIAVRVEPESISALIEGIENVLSYSGNNKIAISYAKLFLDKQKILNRFMNELLT